MILESCLQKMNNDNNWEHTHTLQSIRLVYVYLQINSSYVFERKLMSLQENLKWDVWSSFNVKLIGGGGVQLEQLTASKANDFFNLGILPTKRPNQMTPICIDNHKSWFLTGLCSPKD